ncbi:MAG: hypothetical protein B1H13_00280 [Desulfobacteraceae bacterium 4484_190.3]|nr:MAG: hypothetical protein B1H13_00280 [Desulfobacteraceae bacterium 4484_190.3]
MVRTALEALAAVLGGTQSLHTNSLDEVLAIPTEEAATIALRTQQIIAEESGVANTIDPLGGSYFVEALTNQMEEQAFEIIRKIDDMGGMLSAIEKNYPQQEIADAAYHYQRQTGNRRRARTDPDGKNPTDQERPGQQEGHRRIGKSGGCLFRDHKRDGADYSSGQGARNASGSV